MSGKIKFSVVIPVYNVGAALKKCVESLANQPFNDYEILLIDDGSTDVITLQLLEEYDGRNARIRVFHKKNGGCIDARRYGTIQAQGEYITYGDGDDFFADNYVEVLHKATQQPADLYILNNYLNRIGTEDFYEEKKFPKTGYADMGWVMEEFLHVRMNAVWDKIYRRNLFGEQVDIIPENIIFGEDTYLNNKYLPRVKKVYIYDAAIFYHFVDSVTSVCGSEVTFKRLSDAEVVFNSLDAVKNLAGATNKRCEAFKDFYYGYYVRSIASLRRNNVSKADINANIHDKKIMKNIRVMKASSLKGKIYRMILRYGWYDLAKILGS